MSTDKRSPGEIEAEIGRTRDALGHAFGALGQKFAPKQLLEQGVDMARQSLNGKATEIGQAVIGNPIPLAMIGVGIGWLLFAPKKASLAPVKTNGHDPLDHDIADGALSDEDVISRTAARIEQLAATVEEQLRGSHRESAADDAVTRLRHGTMAVASDGYHAGMAAYEAANGDQPIGESIRRFTETTYERTATYVDEATDAVREAGDRVGEVVDKYPLAIGGLAALAGALLALGLPPTNQEDRVMGGTRDALRDRALDSGRDALARAEETASRAAAAALDAARDEVEAESEPASSPLA